MNVLVEQDQLERQDEAEAVAHEILEFTAKQFNLYYSEAGNLSRAAQTLAHNTLAWYKLLHARNLIKSGEPATAILEEALDHVNAAVEELDYNSGEDSYGPVLESKVEILLALGRSDEAFAVVYQIHCKFPELPYFAQITQSSEYQRWDQEN